MSTLAMSQPFSKTYSRNPRKEDHASKLFDEVILGVSSKPCPVKAASIIQKWGKASFTSTRGSIATDLQKSRKRKIDDEKNCLADDDPFSFDLEDVGPSKLKRGMGYKIPEKSKSTTGATGQQKNTEINKKALREACNLTAYKMNPRLQKSNNKEQSEEIAKGNKKKALNDVYSYQKDIIDDLTCQTNEFDAVLADRDEENGNHVESVQKPSQKKQVQTGLRTSNFSQDRNEASFSKSKPALSKLQPSQPQVPSKKFFVSRDRKADSIETDLPESVTSIHDANLSSDKKDKHLEDWNCTDWNLESDDPEITFNSSKMKSNEEAVVDKDSDYEKMLYSSEKRTDENNVCKQFIIKKFGQRSEETVADKDGESKEMLNSSGKKTEKKMTSKFGNKPCSLEQNGSSLLDLEAKRPSRDARQKISRAKQKTGDQLSKLGDSEKQNPTEASVVRRLLTNSIKNRLKKKPSYNHRQWQNSDNEELSDLSGSQNSSAEQVKTRKDDMAFESSDEEPIKKPLLHRTAEKIALHSGEVVTGIKVSRQDKSLYMVVRNVKRAHECQEYGESQEFKDDVDYILDGLGDSQALSTRCLSAVNLVNKCASHAFRMHLRAHGILTKIFTALHDAAKYPTLALCTAAIMYMMTRDRLALALDESSLELLLQVLNAKASTSDSCGLGKEYEGLQHKIQSVCSGFDRNGKLQQSDMPLSDVTTGHLAMEALLRLTSRRDGDWFKDELRILGGLDHIIDAVSKAVDTFDETTLELTDTAIDMMTKVDQCYRVLENVTYMNVENQNHLINYRSSVLIRILSSCLKVCESCLPFNELTTKGDKVDKNSTGYIIYSCLLATIRVLVNLTHDNDNGIAKIGEEEGLLKTLLTCILRLPRYLPAAERFDLLVLGLCLLVNLIEHSRNNLRVLLNTPAVAPFDQYPSISGTLNSLEALGMLFSLRFEAAKMIEEEHDAELEEKERQHQELTLKCSMDNQLQADESGMWQESDSGIQWIAVSKETKTKDSASGVSDDASSMGDFQVMSGMSSSQDDSENFTKALHKAGRHMEDSIVAAYVALVVGCVIQHNVDLAEKVRDTLPDCSFDPMIRMLRRFLEFMNLITTSSSAANSSKSIQRVLEVLQSC